MASFSWYGFFYSLPIFNLSQNSFLATLIVFHTNKNNSSVEINFYSLSKNIKKQTIMYTNPSPSPSPQASPFQPYPQSPKLTNRYSENLNDMHLVVESNQPFRAVNRYQRGRLGKGNQGGQGKDTDYQDYCIEVQEADGDNVDVRVRFGNSGENYENRNNRIYLENDRRKNQKNSKTNMQPIKKNPMNLSLTIQQNQHQIPKQVGNTNFNPNSKSRTQYIKQDNFQSNSNNNGSSTIVKQTKHIIKIIQPQYHANQGRRHEYNRQSQYIRSPKVNSNIQPNYTHYTNASRPNNTYANQYQYQYQKQHENQYTYPSHSYHHKLSNNSENYQSNQPLQSNPEPFGQSLNNNSNRQADGLQKNYQTLKYPINANANKNYNTPFTNGQSQQYYQSERRYSYPERERSEKSFGTIVPGPAGNSYAKSNQNTNVSKFNQNQLISSNTYKPNQPNRVNQTYQYIVDPQGNTNIGNIGKNYNANFQRRVEENPNNSMGTDANYQYYEYQNNRPNYQDNQNGNKYRTKQLDEQNKKKLQKQFQENRRKDEIEREVQMQKNRRRSQYEKNKQKQLQQRNRMIKQQMKKQREIIQKQRKKYRNSKQPQLQQSQHSKKMQQIQLIQPNGQPSAKQKFSSLAIHEKQPQSPHSPTRTPKQKPSPYPYPYHNQQGDSKNIQISLQNIQNYSPIVENYKIQEEEDIGEESRPVFYNSFIKSSGSQRERDEQGERENQTQRGKEGRTINEYQREIYQRNEKQKEREGYKKKQNQEKKQNQRFGTEQQQRTTPRPFNEKMKTSVEWRQSESSKNSNKWPPSIKDIPINRTNALHIKKNNTSGSSQIRSNEGYMKKNNNSNNRIFQRNKSKQKRTSDSPIIVPIQRIPNKNSTKHSYHKTSNPESLLKETKRIQITLNTTDLRSRSPPRAYPQPPKDDPSTFDLFTINKKKYLDRLRTQQRSHSKSLSNSNLKTFGSRPHRPSSSISPQANLISSRLHHTKINKQPCPRYLHYKATIAHLKMRETLGQYTYIRRYLTDEEIYEILDGFQENGVPERKWPMGLVDVVYGRLRGVL